MGDLECDDDVDLDNLAVWESGMIPTSELDPFLGIGSRVRLFRR